MAKIKVFVIDDNLAARKMLMQMINTQDDMEAVGEGGTLEASLPLITELKPEALLLEIDHSSGAHIDEIMNTLKSASPITQLIACASPDADVEFVIPAAESGATDFVKKPYNKGNLFRTIRNAARR